MNVAMGYSVLLVLCHTLYEVTQTLTFFKALGESNILFLWCKPYFEGWVWLWSLIWKEIGILPKNFVMPPQSSSLHFWVENWHQKKENNLFSQCIEFITIFKIKEQFSIFFVASSKNCRVEQAALFWKLSTLFHFQPKEILFKHVFL